MATTPKKRKIFKAILAGTGINETLLLNAHEIIPFPASTYHKLTYPSGIVQYKNDFGVSSVTLIPVEMTDDEIEKAGY